MTVLSDPRYVVPALPPGDGGGLDRLRRSVARFAAGPEHGVRRAAEARLLAAVDVAALRSAARTATLAGLPRALPGPGPGGLPAAAVALVAEVVVGVLAAGLGEADPAGVAALVPAVAAAYFPGTGDPAPADAAVDALLSRHGLDLARIGLLVQACGPVTALVAAAWPMLAVGSGRDVDAVLAVVLAGAPPVAATRRRHPDTGETVTVPLAGTPFGAGPRRCPGQEHALALAAGALDALAPAGRPAGAVPTTAARSGPPDRGAVVERAAGVGW